MSNEKIKFGVVGSGWRAECYLQIAKQLPDLFEVCGVVTRSKDNQMKISNKWGLKVYSTVDELLEEKALNFIVMSVTKQAAPEVLIDLGEKGVPILAETPPATQLAQLIELHNRINSKAKIQVAEQYHLQPMHAARISLLNTDQFGPIHYVYVSISHGYHSMSLIRKMLGIQYENAVIKASKFQFPIVEGPGRNGPPISEKIIKNDHIVALLDFGGRIGHHEFEVNQHRSWIRSQRIVARGTKGEINDYTVKFLEDFQTPIEYNLARNNAGENENLEGYYLKGIMGGAKWVYKNPFAPARLSDDEIAIATSLVKMNDYIKTDIDFYSLAEAAQDQYLALMIEEAIKKKTEIKTETQVWAL
jgi:predicted dehydrogenase